LHLRKDNVVEKNFWGKFPVKRATAYFRYAKGNDVSRLVYELKYYGNWRLGIFLGKCVANELLPDDFFCGIDYIVPVPLHEKKEKERGYNQSAILAQGISSVTGIPVFKGLIVRRQYTDTQTHKGGYERWMNVEGVFECFSAKNLKGKHILFVDDVLTTGATMVACADALGPVPGLQISVLALALAGDN
jgi:ComF family protein